MLRTRSCYQLSMEPCKARLIADIKPDVTVWYQQRRKLAAKGKAKAADLDPEDPMFKGADRAVAGQVVPGRIDPTVNLAADQYDSISSTRFAAEVEQVSMDAVFAAALSNMIVKHLCRGRAQPSLRESLTGMRQWCCKGLYMRSARDSLLRVHLSLMMMTGRLSGTGGHERAAQWRTLAQPCLRSLRD